MTRFIKILIEVFKLSSTPPSIVYPIPLLALLLFSLSGSRNLLALVFAVAFTFASQAGINLWNHVNDVEEDLIAGKENVLTRYPEIRKYVAVVSFLLYVLAFLVLVVFSKDKKFAISAFLIVSFVTWIYSDRLVLGKLIPRWKDHYLTEVLTYLISVPLYTLTVWTIFARINTRALAVAAFMTPFALSGTFLKDLKDASGDEKAGLRTLAVVFSPSTLLKISVFLLWVYYIEVLFLSLIRYIPLESLLALFTFLGLNYSTIRFVKGGWKITSEMVGAIKIMIYSNLLSLLLITLGCLTLLP